MRTPSLDSDNDEAAEMYSEQPSFAVQPLNVVSLQSTSRPGCIIELVPIADAIQVLHTSLVAFYCLLHLRPTKAQCFVLFICLCVHTSKHDIFEDI